MPHSQHTATGLCTLRGLEAPWEEETIRASYHWLLLCTLLFPQGNVPLGWRWCLQTLLMRQRG